MLDLWQKVWTTLEVRSGDVRATWVKSHPTRNQIDQYQISPHGLVANSVADVFAGVAAEWGALDSDLVKT
eukprot:9302689-Pyramimonas_sp.AAC.1